MSLRNRLFARYKKTDILIFAVAIVGLAFYFVGHHHSGHDDEGPGVEPVAAHDYGNSTTQSIVAVAEDDSGFTPQESVAKLCDKLVITNTGKASHWPAVGPHPYHTALPGFDALRPLKPGEKFEFILNRPGKYPFHDHLNEDSHGTITINE